VEPKLSDADAHMHGIAHVPQGARHLLDFTVAETLRAGAYTGCATSAKSAVALDYWYDVFFLARGAARPARRESSVASLSSDDSDRRRRADDAGRAY